MQFQARRRTSVPLVANEWMEKYADDDLDVRYCMSNARICTRPSVAVDSARFEDIVPGNGSILFLVIRTSGTLVLRRFTWNSQFGAFSLFHVKPAVFESFPFHVERFFAYFVTTSLRRFHVKRRKNRSGSRAAFGQAAFIPKD
jgi:hypothetical protein